MDGWMYSGVMTIYYTFIVHSALIALGADIGAFADCCFWYRDLQLIDFSVDKVNGIVPHLLTSSSIELTVYLYKIFFIIALFTLAKSLLLTACSAFADWMVLPVETSVSGTAKVPYVVLQNLALQNHTTWPYQHSLRGTAKLGTAKLPRTWHCKSSERGTAQFSTTKLPRTWHCRYSVRGPATFATVKLPNMALPKLRTCYW